MATRIVIISSHPGRIRHIIPNPLPYPRDVNSKGFQSLVDAIHDAITALALPDEHIARDAGPPAPHEAADETRKAGKEAVRRRVESIPQVPVGRMVGLLEVLEDSKETVDIFELSASIGKEFGDTIAIVKGSEMLELVDTPKHEVFLTGLGRQFLAADHTGRKAIFARQLLKLRLFQFITDCLQKSKKMDADILLEELAILLPYDQPEKLFETIVDWGRYAEILDYDTDSHCIFVPEDE